MNSQPTALPAACARVCQRGRLAKVGRRVRVGLASLLNHEHDPMIPVAELREFEIAKGGSIPSKELLDPCQQVKALAAAHLDDLQAAGPHHVNIRTPHQP